MTNAFDQGLRFSVDRPTYELLYLPLAAARTGCHSRTPSTSSARGSRTPLARCVYGILTVGFLMVLPGLGFDLRGTAFINRRS